MKTLIITAILLLFTLPAFAADYKAITKDNEVENVNKVVVEETATVTTGKYTLIEIDALITALEVDKAAIQKRIDNLGAIRSAVETEAKKIILKSTE